MTMHTSITHGGVCKKQSFPGLPQTTRSVTEEEDEEDDENCVQENFALAEMQIYF